MKSEINDLMTLNPSSNRFNDLCQRISKDIKDNVVDLVTVIENFSTTITSKNVDEQKIGLTALSNIFKYLPNEKLNEIQLKVICEFYSSLLKTSNQLCRNLLEGVEHLIKQKHLTSDQAWSLLMVITTHVDLKRRDLDDRLLTQRIVIGIIKNNVKSFIQDDKNSQLYLIMLQMLDGETDPVCINTIFNFLPDFFKQFTINSDSELCEEFSKVLWYYFPINYSSSASVKNISREVLSKQLEDCILGNRSFAKYTIDNILEQLNGLEDKFEFDTLILLRNSFAKYPLEIYVEHFNSLISVIKYEAFYNNDKRVNQAAIECFGQLLINVKNILQTDNRLYEILEKLIKNDLYNKLASELGIATKMLLEIIKIECDLSKDVIDHLTPILINEINCSKNHSSIIINAMELIQLYRKEINTDFNLLCFDLLKAQQVSENIFEANNAYLDAILSTIDLFTVNLRNDLWITLKFVIENKSIALNKSKLINTLKKLSKHYDYEISSNIFSDLNENNVDNVYEILVVLAEISPKFSYDIIVQQLLTFGFSKVIVFKHCVAILKTIPIDNSAIQLILNYAILNVKEIQSDNDIESELFFEMIVQLFYYLFLKFTNSFEEIQKFVLPYVKNLTLLAVYDAIFRYCNKSKLIAILNSDNNYFERFINEYKSWNVVNIHYLNYWCSAIVYVFMKLNDDNLLHIIENTSMFLEHSEKKYHLWSWILTVFLMLNDSRSDDMINRVFNHLEQMYKLIFQIVSMNFIGQDREVSIQNVLYKQAFFVKAIVKFNELIKNLHKNSTDFEKYYKIVYVSYGHFLTAFPQNLFVIHFKQFSGELLNIIRACEEDNVIIDLLCVQLGKLIIESRSGVYNETLVPLCLEFLKKQQNVKIRHMMLRILIEITRNSKPHELERFRNQILNLSQVMLNDHKRIIRMKASELVICCKLCHS